MSSHQAETAHKYLETLNAKNMDGIREIFADDATVEDPVGTDPHVGMEAIVAFYEAGFAADIKTEMKGDPRVAGNTVAFSFQVHAHGMIIEPIDVFEFNEAGKVSSMKAYWGEANCKPA